MTYSNDNSGAFVFTINEAIFDFSDFRNGTVKFPNHYYEQGLLMPDEKNWRGVYIKTVEVALPRVFKTVDSKKVNKPIVIGAQDLLIDNYGISGIFYADDVFPIEKGITNNEKSWAYSLDYISINIQASRITGANFKGGILLPISKSATKYQLAYQGLISEQEYQLKVVTKENIDFNIWKAKGTLTPNSSIELTIKEGEFKPKAILNGYVDISLVAKKDTSPQNSQTLADNTPKEDFEENDNQEATGKKIVDFKGIVFEALTLQTEAPYFSANYFGYKGEEVKFSGFEAAISNIELKIKNESADLVFRLSVGLMNKKDKGFAAEGDLVIRGMLIDEEDKHKWGFNGLAINEFMIDATVGSISLKGQLKIKKNDPIYGNGFFANVEGKFGEFGPLAATAIFGEKEFKYWYADAAIEGFNIPCVAGMELNGFAGGAYYKMTRNENAPKAEIFPSGLVYKPDSTMGLGIKAAIFGSVKEKVMNFSVGFELLTTQSLGIAKMGMYGEAIVLKSFDFPNPLKSLTDKLNEISKVNALESIAYASLASGLLDVAKKNEQPESIVGQAEITLQLGMEMDFFNKIYHAEMETYISVAGNVIQGIGPNSRAGWAVLHISPKEWYMYIGTPVDRLGLKIGFGGIHLNAQSYFMVGNKIPASPPPPPIVAQILGTDAKKLDYMRDENSLGEGKGFAFGADFSVDTGDMTFLFFYARFQAGAGFDIMLKDYGGATCSNRNGKELGINGWYANGQAYAYLQGELGIRIKLFFIKKKIPIIKGAAAVLLQTKAPNPFWMKGYVGGYYNLLGGLIKGKFRFKVELGEKCEFANASPLGGIKMITSVVPNEGEGEVDVFAAPQASFAMSVNNPILLTEDSGDKTYRVVLEKFEVKDEEGKIIEGKINWNRMKDIATFISTDILPPNKKLKATVEVSFQEQISGVFQTIMTEGKKAVELEERTFTTGIAPNVIPLQNITYAYPVLDQKNFYTKEYEKGYIVLNRGQDYLFEDPKWNSEIIYKSADEKEQKLNFTYDVANNRLDYILPELSQEKTYTLIINSYPKNVNPAENTNETTATTKVENIDEDNTIETTVKEANIAINTNTTQIERLTYNFKTSKYQTFEQKIKAFKISDNQWGKIASDVIYLQNKIYPDEPFDLIELIGNDYTQTKPLVEIEALLNDNYYKQDIATLLYTKYPIEGQFYIERDDKLKDQYDEPENIGIPPSRAIPILNSYLTYLEGSIREDWLKTTFPYYYNLPYYYKSDKVELENKIANFYADKPTQMGADALKLLKSPFLFIREGLYEVELRYQLPGGIKGSRVNFSYYNDLKFRPNESTGDAF